MTLLLLTLLLAGGLHGQDKADPPQELPKPTPVPKEPYFGSNLIVVASRHVVNSLMARSNESTDPISDNYEGNQITGISQTTSQLTSELIANPDRGMINLVVRGVTNGQTTSRSSQFPVTLQNQGVVTFEARKPVFIDETGITWMPTQTCARARSELLDVETDLKHDKMAELLKMFASQQYYQRKPKAEKRQAERAEERINERTDQQTEERLAEMNKMLQQRFDEMRTGGLHWTSLKYQSTTVALRAAFMAIEAVKTPAKEPPPEAPWPSDVSFRAHQGAINQYLENRYAGKTYKDDELRKELGGFFGGNGQQQPKPEPKDGEEPAKPDPYKLTFDDTAPVTVDAKENRLTLVLTAKMFYRLNEKGDVIRGYPMIRITVPFKVLTTATGPKLQRSDDVVAEPLKKVPGVLEATVAIERQMNKLFTDTPRELPPLKPTGNMARIGPMKATHARAENGWLTIGYER
jgi:hypothetical protein